MKFAKWGNSIALRVPAEIVAKLGISPNEEVQIRVTGENSFEVTRDRRRQDAIERLRQMRVVVPDNFVFNRDEKSMTGRMFFDTNIVVYALAVRASSPRDPRNVKAEELLGLGGAVSAQVLNEFADVASWKMKMSWEAIIRSLGLIEALCGPCIPLTAETTKSAADLSRRYGFRMYDSLIVATAIAAGCTTLMTEDLHHGQIIDGLRIENPFL